MTEPRPTLNVAAHDRVSDAALTQVLLGIEEEGVPYLVQRSTELNPLGLAHDAAVSSRLGVGVGISLDYAVVTTDKLCEDRPYLAYHLGVSPEADRIIGSNAARLVKRLPLRLAETERSH